MSLSTKHVIWTLSMGGASAFISRPHHGGFLCTKTNCQSPGWGGVSRLGTDSHEGLGVLKNSQNIIDE